MFDDEIGIELIAKKKAGSNNASNGATRSRL